MKRILLSALAITTLFSCNATEKITDNTSKNQTVTNTKSSYWQQHVSYKMDIDILIEKVWLYHIV